MAALALVLAVATLSLPRPSSAAPHRLPSAAPSPPALLPNRLTAALTAASINPSQEVEVGDGTNLVVVLAGELLSQVDLPFVTAVLTLYPRSTPHPPSPPSDTAAPPRPAPTRPCSLAAPRTAQDPALQKKNIRAHQAEELLKSGLHVSEIIGGYKAAEAKAKPSRTPARHHRTPPPPSVPCRRALVSPTRPAPSRRHAQVLASIDSLVTHTSPPAVLHDAPQLASALRSVIASKQWGNEELFAAKIAEACAIAMPADPTKFNPDNIRVAKILGSSVPLPSRCLEPPLSLLPPRNARDSRQPSQQHQQRRKHGGRFAG